MSSMSQGIHYTIVIALDMKCGEVLRVQEEKWSNVKRKREKIREDKRREQNRRASRSSDVHDLNILLSHFDGAFLEQKRERKGWENK